MAGALHHICRWYALENESDAELRPGIELWTKTLDLQKRIILNDDVWPVTYTYHEFQTALDQIEAFYADKVDLTMPNSA